MNEEFVPETLRAFSFGKLVVYGVSYHKRGESAGVGRAWHLTLLEPATPEHPDIRNEYWVCGTEFRRVVQRILFEDGRPGSTIVHEDTPIEPPITEKEAALKAIAAWEKRSVNG